MSKDPVLRVFVIIVLGVILFQLLFNLITGGSMGDMGSSGMMGNSSTTLDSMITGLLILLVKLLIIGLVISLIIGAVIWMKKNFFKNINLSQNVNQNPMIKSILSIAGAIVGLLLLIYLYNYLINPGMGYGNEMSTSSGSANMVGFSGTLGLTGVFTFLIKVLTYVFVITLIISLVAYFKKQIETGEMRLFGSDNISKENDPMKKDSNTNTQSNTAVSNTHSKEENSIE
jgi:predicted lipid-binding transport protein (Tim44 family)